MRALVKKEKTPTALACDIWVAVMRGPAPGGRIAAMVRDLTKLGTDPAELLATWEFYLRNEDTRFASPQSFAGKFGPWRDRAMNQHQRRGAWHSTMQGLFDWATP